MPDSATLCTAVHQAPVSMRFSRQGYWSGLPFPSPEDLPNPGIKPRSPALWQILFPAEALGKHRHNLRSCLHWRLEPGPSACKSDLLQLYSGIEKQISNFPDGSDGKASVYNAGDPGSIPGSGRSPGEGNGNPLQYPCLESLMDTGAWWTAVHGVAKSWAQLSD